MSKNKLETINASIVKLTDQSNEIADKLTELCGKRDELITELISDEHLLKNSKWELKYSGQVMLEYLGSIDDNIIGPILGFSKSEGDSLYHYIWLQLEPGIQFRIDEQEVSLHFDEPKMILPFATKHGLKITGSDVADRLRALKRETAAIEQICHQFAIKE